MGEKTRQRFFILICEACDSSFACERGDLPDRCAVCRQKPPRWRAALSLELTKSDRGFLRGLFIEGWP